MAVRERIQQDITVEGVLTLCVVQVNRSAGTYELYCEIDEEPPFSFPFPDIDDEPNPLSTTPCRVVGFREDGEGNTTVTVEETRPSDLFEDCLTEDFVSVEGCEYNLITTRVFTQPLGCFFLGDGAAEPAYVRQTIQFPSTGINTAGSFYQYLKAIQLAAEARAPVNNFGFITEDGNHYTLGAEGCALMNSIAQQAAAMCAQIEAYYHKLEGLGVYTPAMSMEVLTPFEE